MREALAARDEERAVFRATFVRFGSKRGWKGDLPTLLLRGIRTPSGEVVSDHLWFNVTKEFGALDLKPGEVVEFRARVKEYEKGYFGRREDVYDKEPETDYKLSHPTKARKLEQKENRDDPTDPTDAP